MNKTFIRKIPSSLFAFNLPDNIYITNIFLVYKCNKLSRQQNEQENEPLQ